MQGKDLLKLILEHFKGPLQPLQTRIKKNELVFYDVRIDDGLLVEFKVMGTLEAINLAQRKCLYNQEQFHHQGATGKLNTSFKARRIG